MARKVNLIKFCFSSAFRSFSRNHSAFEQAIRCPKREHEELALPHDSQPPEFYKLTCCLRHKRDSRMRPNGQFLPDFARCLQILHGVGGFMSNFIHSSIQSLCCSGPLPIRHGVGGFTTNSIHSPSLYYNGDVCMCMCDFDKLCVCGCVAVCVCCCVGRY